MSNSKNKGRTTKDKAVMLSLVALTAMGPITSPIMAMAEEGTSQATTKEVGSKSEDTKEVEGVKNESVEGVILPKEDVKEDVKEEKQEVSMMSNDAVPFDFGTGEVVHDNNGVRSFVKLDKTVYYNPVTAVLYYKAGTKVTVSGTTLAEDVGGINDVNLIRVLRLGDNHVLASTDKSTLEFELANCEDKNVNIEISGTRDGVTKTSVIALSVYLNSAYTGAKVDEVTPTISGGLSGNVVDNIYTGAVNGDYTLQDTLSGIDTATVSVLDNGASRAKTYDEGTGKLNFSIDGEGYHSIVIAAKDHLGNEKSSTIGIVYDSIAPYIQEGSIDNLPLSYNGKSYTNKSLAVKYWFKDVTTEVKNVEVLKNNVLYSTPGVAKGSFNITENGTYSVRVTDKAGNVKVYMLSELVNGAKDEIVFDTTLPTVTATINGGAVSTTNWYKDTAKYDFSISDNVTVNKLEYTVAGNKTTEAGVVNGDSFSVNLEDFVDVKGEVTVKVDLYDIAGNVYSYEETYKVDKVNPVVSDMRLDGVTYLREDGKRYFNSVLRLTANGADAESGFKNASLINSNNASKTELGTTTSIQTEISKSGKYQLDILDNVGHLTSVPFSTLGEGYADLVWDSTNPVVTTGYSDAPKVVKDGKDWFVSLNGVNVNIEEDNLQSVNIKLNGVDVVNDSNSAVKKTYTVDTRAAAVQGANVIEYTVTDKAENTVTGSKTFYVDATNSEITASSLVGDYFERGYGVFFKADGTVNIRANDGNIGVGTESVKLKDLTDGTVQESKTAEGTDVIGSFALTKNGHEYTVIITDYLGNTKSIDLDTVFGLTSSLIYVDTESPVITSSRPAGDVNGWYATDKTYTAVASDANGVASAKVEINGTVVDSFSASAIVKQKVLYGATSKVSANADGSYNVVVTMVSNSGKTTSWTDTVYMDRTAPVVDKFVFTGEGIQEGAITNGSDKYGFYFKGAADVKVHVSDGAVSSGMKTLYYTLTGEGTPVTGESQIVNGIAEFSIPEGFKGIVSAYADDNVENVGVSNKADGVITENPTWHVNNKKLSIELPTTPYKDGAGLNLYNANVTAKAYISDTVSGIREIQYGTNENTLGTVTIDNEGVIHGDGVTINSKDKNLIVDLDKALEVGDNVNGLKLWVKVTDRSGYVSEDSTLLSIDKDVPEIGVTYDVNKESGYYSENRTATIAISERNFRQSDVKLSGDLGAVSGWSQGADGNWYNTVTFTEDGNYNWSVDYTDMAGNVAKTYNSGNFTIDKVAPTLSVSFDNNSALNGNFFKQGRTATVTVVDKNFDSSLVQLVGSGSLSAWSTEGDTHTATVSFSTDGEYEFSILAKDKSGNTSSTFNSGKFIIDTAIPTISIDGVSNGVTYKKNVGFRVNIADTYLDSSNSSITLISRTRGAIEVNGSFDESTGSFTFEGFPEGVEYDDIYNLTVKASDKAGNVIENRLQFALNRYGSRYEFLGKDLLNTYIKELKGNIEITETSVNKLDESTIRIVVLKDGKPYNVDSKYIDISYTGGEDSLYVYKYTIDKEAFKEDGKYQIQVYSVSTDGTENTSLREEYSFILDTTPPEIIISGVKDGGFYDGNSQKVTIDVRDLSEITEMSIKVNGDKVEAVKENGVYVVNIKESAEEQNIVVTAKDATGLSSTEEVKNFKISTDTVGHILGNNWFKVLIGAIGAVIVGLLLLLIGKKRKSNKKEEALAKEHARMYQDSSSSSAGSKGSSEE